MGNRAVITWNRIHGVYVHWNGGEDSIRPFLKYCELHNFRNPTTDCYGFARFIQVIANFMGEDGLSVGVDFVANLDDSDNGIYYCDKWKIVRRDLMNGRELGHDPYKMLKTINDAQPEKMRLPDVKLKLGAQQIVAEHEAFYKNWDELIEQFHKSDK